MNASCPEHFGIDRLERYSIQEIGQNLDTPTIDPAQDFDTGEFIIPPNIARPVFYVSQLMLIQVLIFQYLLA